MTPEALAAKVRAGTATEADKLQLFDSVKRFCRKIALEYRAALRCSDEIEDLMQESYFAVMDAAQSYYENAGSGFLNWMVFYVRRYYDGYIGHQAGKSASFVQRRNDIAKFERDYFDSYGVEPSDKEICEHFKMAPETLAMLRNGGKEKSLNTPLDEEESFELLETISDPHDLEAETIEKIINEEVSKTLLRFIYDLPPQERDACIMYYVYNWTDKKGSEAMGIKVSSFQRFRKKAIKTLQRSRSMKELGRYLPERIEVIAYQGFNFQKWESSTERAAIKKIEIDNRRKKAMRFHLGVEPDP